MHNHAATEALLAEGGGGWTALRQGFYAFTIPQLVGNVLNTGVVTAPADSRIVWTTHVDLGAGAARALADEGRFDGPAEAYRRDGRDDH